MGERAAKFNTDRLIGRNTGEGMMKAGMLMRISGRKE